MQASDPSYAVRLAVPADAPAIAQQRACMFRDMGALSVEQAHQLMEASIPWLREQLQDHAYIGWFVLDHQEIVAGGGMHLSFLAPMPGCCRGGRGGHIANLYTSPPHRRRGLARRLMQIMLDWAETQHLNRITLSASGQGRSLYTSLGFMPGAQMELLLAPEARHPRLDNPLAIPCSSRSTD